jgi:four helix bundle protein
MGNGLKMVDGGQGSDDVGRTASIQSFEDLEVFRRAMALVKPVHDLVRDFPPFEQADLGQQMRRASKSVPANIAEGFSRRLTARDFKLYLAHALGSANEMTVHLRIAVALEYAPELKLGPLIEEYRILARQLARLIQVWRDPREREIPSPRPTPRLIHSDHRPPPPSS